MKELPRLSLRILALVKRRLPLALCCIPVVVVGVLAAVGAGLFSKGRVSTMDVNTIFLLVMGLACPIGMGLMMWLMNRQMNQNAGGPRLEGEPSPRDEDRLAQLRLRRQLLDEEIKQLEAQNTEVVTGITPMRDTDRMIVQRESE